MSDDGYEYTVRYQELDANGKPCGWDYYEWSGGFERVVSRSEAEYIAQQWREDPSDWMGDVQIVRRVPHVWEPVPVDVPE